MLCLPAASGNALCFHIIYCCALLGIKLAFSVKRIHILKHFKSGICKYSHVDCSKLCFERFSEKNSLKRNLWMSPELCYVLLTNKFRDVWWVFKTGRGAVKKKKKLWGMVLAYLAMEKPVPHYTIKATHPLQSALLRYYDSFTQINISCANNYACNCILLWELLTSAMYKMLLIC